MTHTTIIGPASVGLDELDHGGGHHHRAAGEKQ
jgi:hypothetical protein